MVVLMSSTLGVSWFAYVKTQARVIAAKSAFALSQPDSDPSEARSLAQSAFLSQLGMANVRVGAEVFGSISEIRINASTTGFAGPVGLPFPELAVITHEVLEFER